MEWVGKLKVKNGFKLILRILKRPDLYFVFFIQIFRLAPVGWFRKYPFLPVPDKGWLEFRLETQYGSKNAEIEINDLIHFLEWCKSR